MGSRTVAESYISTALGRYNVGGGNATSWVSTEPLFEIGIGTSDLNRNNAMTVLKNGNVGIGTTAPTSKLHVKVYRVMQRMQRQDQQDLLLVVYIKPADIQHYQMVFLWLNNKCGYRRDTDLKADPPVTLVGGWSFIIIYYTRTPLGIFHSY